MHRRLLRSEFEFVYGHASVLAALHSQKRQRLKTLYLQSASRSSPVTTKKKDRSAAIERDIVASKLTRDVISTLIESIVEQCRQRNIPVITTNKGELNNLTQDKPHQAREKEEYDYDWMLLNHEYRVWYSKHRQEQPLSSRIQRIFDQVSGLHWIKFKILR